MIRTHCFYAQRIGKSYSNFNQSPLFFKMFAQTEPVKVIVAEIDDNSKATHFGWLNKEFKIEHIHQKEEDVKMQLKGDVEELERSGKGKFVRLAVFDYKTQEMAA